MKFNNSLIKITLILSVIVYSIQSGLHNRNKQPTNLVAGKPSATKTEGTFELRSGEGASYTNCCFIKFPNVDELVNSKKNINAQKKVAFESSKIYAFVDKKPNTLFMTNRTYNCAETAQRYLSKFPGLKGLQSQQKASCFEKQADRIIDNKDALLEIFGINGAF